MVGLGDYVIVNDIVGCVRSVDPMVLLCQDGVERRIDAEPQLLATGQQCALMVAEKAMACIRKSRSSI